MPAKFPWFPFYGVDFFTDEKVQEMTHAQIGMYLRMLQHQWTEGSIPASYPASVLKLSSVEVAFSQLLDAHDVPSDAVCYDLVTQCEAIIEHCFVPHPTVPDRMINRKLHAIAEDQAKLHERKQAGGRRSRLLQDSLKTPRRQHKDSSKTPGQSQSHNQSQNQRENKESLPNGFSYDSNGAKTETPSRKPKPRSVIDLIDQGLMPNLETSQPS